MVSAIYEHVCENGFIDYQCVLLTVFTGALPEHGNALPRLPRQILGSSLMNVHAKILCHTQTHDVGLGLICSHKCKKTINSNIKVPLRQNLSRFSAVFSSFL